MPNHPPQSSSPPASRLSQIGGWTVYKESQPASTNDSEDSDIAEQNFSPSGKRKAKNVASSRPAKSPRISSSSVSAGASRPPFPNSQPRHTLSSLGDLRPAGSRVGTSSTGSIPQRMAKTKISAPQPKAGGSSPLSDKRHLSVKSSAATRPLDSSGSVPLLRKGIYSSKPVLKSKTKDRDGSSSSDSLPDPLALISLYGNAPAKPNNNETGGKGKEKATDSGASTRKGINGASSSVPNFQNPLASQKIFLQKSKPSGSGMAAGEELIIISSDSDDELRAVPGNSMKGRYSQQRKTKDQGSKTLTDSDDAIDVTSDADMPTLAESQHVRGSPRLSLSNMTPETKASRSSSGVSKIHSSRSVIALPLPANFSGAKDTQSGGSSAPVINRSKVLRSQSRSSLRGDSEHRQSLATSGKDLAPRPKDPEVIDLCSDSDEAMEVDGLLPSVSGRPDAGTPPDAVNSASQPAGDAPTHARPYALPLPRPLPRLSSPQLNPTPHSSSSLSVNRPQLAHDLKPAGLIDVATSVSQRPTFTEASSAVDAIFSRARLSESSRRPAFGVQPSQNAEAGPSTSSATSAPPSLNRRTYRTDTLDFTMETLSSSSSKDIPVQDPTEALVAPVSGMHLQASAHINHDASPDPIDTFVQEGMVVDTPLGSDRSQNGPSEHASPASSSPLELSTSDPSESSGPSIQHARKTAGKNLVTNVSETGSRSDMSEKEHIEMQKHEDEPIDATVSTRHIISVKQPDFSKLRADNPSALDDAGSLSHAIQWPAEKIPTELHDMINRLPANYHHNPQMKYIFESMMEENTAEDEPTSPRIEVYSGQNGPVCPPWEFYYTNRIFRGKGVPRSNKKLLKGCDCDGPCDPTSKTCACVKRQMGWTGDDKDIKGFLYNKKGKILNPGYPIFECNDACECSEECMNRVIQNGRQHQISICLTDGKGWGVHADEKIPRGTYLGIYSGEMLLESEAGERGKLYDRYGRTYLFDMDFYYLHSLEADKHKVSTSNRDGAPSASQSSAGDKDEDKSNLYTIDAFHVGNFTRFLNHSCDPNCVITPSYVNEPDLQKPTLTIFTTRDVKKGEELCFSYFGNDDDDEDEEDQVDEHGQKKKVVAGPATHTAKAIHRPCLCKAPNCRGKMF